MNQGQFDDSYTPSIRILFENQANKSSKEPTKKNKVL
jgi:nitrogen fixation-related uncharacterized protein